MTPAAADALSRAARDFAPTTLAELGGAALMDRVDTKFLLPAALAPELLRAVAGHYRALEIAGERLCRYETLYYDTADLALYHAHHAGRPTRRKVRRRSYVETGQHFLEVKLRTAAGRTRKARVPLDGDGDDRGDALYLLGEAPLRELAGELADAALGPVMRVAYARLTLVRLDGAERVTLDSRVAVAGARGSASFPDAVILEVKQARRGRSPLLDALRAAGLRAGAISKYCLGVATLVPGVKTNRYKRVLHQLHHAPTDHAPPVAR